MRGGASYGARCAQCHGGDAKGITGPDLTLLWAIGTSDDRVFQAIQAGVPGAPGRDELHAALVQSCARHDVRHRA